MTTSIKIVDTTELTNRVKEIFGHEPQQATTINISQDDTINRTILGVSSIQEFRKKLEQNLQKPLTEDSVAVVSEPSKIQMASASDFGDILRQSGIDASQVAVVYASDMDKPEKVVNRKNTLK